MPPADETNHLDSVPLDESDFAEAPPRNHLAIALDGDPGSGQSQEFEKDRGGRANRQLPLLTVHDDLHGITSGRPSCGPAT